MRLTERLRLIRSGELEEIGPPDVRQVMERTTNELLAAGLAEQARNVGQQAPDFELLNTDGARVSSTTLRQRGPMVLTFYRGLW